jgi:hypothetical protein
MDIIEFIETTVLDTRTLLSRTKCVQRPRPRRPYNERAAAVTFPLESARARSVNSADSQRGRTA